MGEGVLRYEGMSGLEEDKGRHGVQELREGEAWIGCGLVPRVV